jgi:hypothetical protein
LVGTYEEGEKKENRWTLTSSHRGENRDHSFWVVIPRFGKKVSSKPGTYLPKYEASHCKDDGLKLKV